ncbi:choline-phosphate cytidylyltransferase [Paenibacillus agaridevorans]|uniref:Choline-phosphate cytidylyltransferase n=1 Tax=Paenibacillus agaridevorans TaxID=171404 RepID=A0A2R5ERG3_9BACL|nr:phosphocholine cytidylyltransferase family protein [Paenibacillus agaridevorans]GBG06363.1 choline-phosphate cytidylyltransferase [Paenibacillus agaridevorans]
MKAILMAAGKGTRISRMIAEVPKSTLPISGVPLIRHTVSMLLGEGMEVSVCVGYQSNKIMEALEGLPVTFYHNPLYDITNSIVSLWFAKQEINDDMLLLNADVYFSKDILIKMLEDQHEAVVAMDTSRVEVGDYFFKTINGCVKKYGKDLPITERNCEYVGMAKVKKDFTETFCRQMDNLIYTQQHGRWWEEVLYTMTADENIYTLDVNGLFWSEIDYFDDYERILMHIESNGQ